MGSLTKVTHPSVIAAQKTAVSAQNSEAAAGNAVELSNAASVAASRL